MTPTALLLMAEDEPATALARQIAARGHAVCRVTDTAAATAALVRDPPQLALLALDDADALAWLEHNLPFLGRARLLLLSVEWPPPPSLRTALAGRGAALTLRSPAPLAEVLDQIDRLLSIGASSVPAAAPELRDELAAVRATYARRLPRLYADVAQAWALGRDGDVAATSQTQRLAHRLRGTAGTYGFVALADALAAVDEALEQRLAGELDVEAARQTTDAALARAAQSLARVEAAAPVATDGDSAEARHRLLVLDDDPDLLTYAAALGRRQGVRVIAARTGAEALEQARLQPPDAALLDVHLDDETSFALTLALRELPACQALPLAFLSSDARAETRVQAAYAGGRVFLDKPLDEAKMSAMLTRLLAETDERRPRVLVVDDDVSFNSYVSVLLQRAGMLTQTLADPMQLVDTLARVRPELVLLDVAMTGLSGFDLCRLIRTSAEWQHVIVVFVTAQASARSRANAFAAGADDFLSKPVVDDELLAHVRVHLDNQRLRRLAAERDPVTGLGARRPFVEAAATRPPQALALVRVDGLDAPGARGLLAGERVLSEVGRRVAARFPADARRCRWAEATFALGFDSDAPTAVALVERLGDEVAALRFSGDDGTLFAVRCAAGIAAAPDDGVTLAQLADIAQSRLERRDQERGGGEGQRDARRSA